METNEPITLEAESPDELKWLEKVSDFLDSKYRIPATNVRFGADFVIGLIPTVGDLFSFGLSSVLIIAMVRHGVSTWLLIRMLGNLVLDVVTGVVPIVGDLFDLTYKANRRNFELLKTHYEAGKPRGNTFFAVLTVLFLLFAVFIFLLWIVWKISAWGWEQLMVILG